MFVNLRGKVNATAIVAAHLLFLQVCVGRVNTPQINNDEERSETAAATGGTCVFLWETWRMGNISRGLAGTWFVWPTHQVDVEEGGLVVVSAPWIPNFPKTQQGRIRQSGPQVSVTDILLRPRDDAVSFDIDKVRCKVYSNRQGTTFVDVTFFERVTKPQDAQRTWFLSREVGKTQVTECQELQIAQGSIGSCR